MARSTARPCTRHLSAFLAAAGAGLVLLSFSTLPGRADVGGASEAGSGGQGTLAALQKAMSQIRSMEAQLEAGSLVPKFGERAQEIIAQAASAGPQLASVVEGALEPLFLRQLTMLKQQILSSASPEDADAVAAMEKQFLEQASELTGSAESWDYEPEHRKLRGALEHQLYTTAAIAEERARAALQQRSTIEVIGRLQLQMEELAQKAQSVRGGGGSPWVLSTSYRIPNTPLQFVSRYEQGRANVEINLTPDKDPSKGDGGFAQAVGPANVGVSFDLGL